MLFYAILPAYHLKDNQAIAHLLPGYMDLLDKIIAYKKEELAVRKLMVEEESLYDSAYFHRTCLSLTDALKGNEAPQIIAGFKRRSPRKASMQPHQTTAEVMNDFVAYGASAVFVYTDHYFFGGNTEDMVIAREQPLPLIREDFIIDPYQVIASKAMGADAIMLVASILEPGAVEALSGKAKEIGLNCILEVHHPEDLAHLNTNIDMVCINRCNRRNYQVDTTMAAIAAREAGNERPRLCGGGIDSVATVKELSDLGFSAILISGIFMKEPFPGKAFASFMQELKGK